MLLATENAGTRPSATRRGGLDAKKRRQATWRVACRR